MAPLIIAERRIILFLVSFIAGIFCFHQLDHSALHCRQLLQITAAAFSVTVALLIMFIWTWVRARSGPFLGPLIYALFCCASGYALAALQYSLHQPVQLDAPFSTSVTAKIIHIDGQASGRSRLWLAVIDTMPRHPYLPDARLRLSSEHVPEDATIGAVVEMRARLFPPPKRLLPGIPDFGRNARIADIVSSGFVTSKIQVVTPPTHLSPSLFLGLVRENLATSLHGDLATPAGGGLPRRLLLVIVDLSASQSMQCLVHLVWRIFLPFRAYIWGFYVLAVWRRCAFSPPCFRNQQAVSRCINMPRSWLS